MKKMIDSCSGLKMGFLFKSIIILYASVIKKVPSGKE